MLIYNAEDIKNSISTFNAIDIEDYINIYIKKMYDDHLYTIQIPVDKFSKHDMIVAKDLLKSSGFKSIFVKDENEFTETITVFVL